MNKKITVILWLYHLDLAQEFYDKISPLEDLITLRLCLCEDNNNQNAVNLFNQLECLESINYYPNIGVDIYSFLNEIEYIKTDYFIKLHSKKNSWGTYSHCNWRQILIDSFIGDRDTLLSNLSILQPNTGYLSSEPFTYINDEGRNSEKIKELLQLLDCPKILKKNKKFSGGNMFIGNTDLFKKVFMPYKKELLSLIGEENGKVNDNAGGTYCHSLERIFGYIGYLYRHKLLFSIPKTFNILTPSAEKKDKMRFRFINNQIYCVNQPNIYGDVINRNRSFFRVKWLHRPDFELQYYVPIAKNSFINTKYLS